MNITKLLYNIVLNNKIKTNNYFYNTTLDLGIKAFFKNYNPSFDSLNKIITVDYIPLKPNTNLGITFIYNYSESINLENKFFNQFNLDNLNLDSNLLINLAYFVLELVIILKYLKLDIYSLTTSIDFSSLYQEYELFKIFSNLKLIDLMALKKYYCLSNSYVLDSLNRFIYRKSIKEQELINSYYKYIKLA